MKLWGGRFKKETNQLVEQYTSSITFDQLLFQEDIQGSLAHVSMLEKCGIIPATDVKKIKAGLKEILQKIESGDFEFRVSDEDIHMNVERALTELIGPVAGKLHTGRSRNDQVALDMHLYVRKQILLINQQLSELQASLLQQAEANLGTFLPGYTHLQRAQPVLLSHHLLVYVWMFQRDSERFKDIFARANICPLGAGALAGTTFPTDRQYVADLLKFDGLYENSMDAVSDRDFVVEFISAAALTLTHLSRISEELILWSSTEFGFIELDDAYTTGSSIMPQKKNPDVAELVRGKTGRVYGALIGILTVLKGLPLTYNKDMQEDKEGIFDTVTTLSGALELYTGMIATLQVNKDRMQTAVRQDFSNATDIADYLAKKGLPFREAHEVIGKLVAFCLEQKCFLLDLKIEDFKAHSQLFENDVYQVLQAENVVNARTTRGGTAQPRVEEQLSVVKEKLKLSSDWLKTKQQLLELDI